jgi:hypothetical protein
VDLNTRKDAYPKKVQQKRNGVYTDRRVPVDLWLGIGTYIPWYKAYWLSHTRMSRLTQVPHYCKQGDTSLCPMGSRERCPCRVNWVLGLPFPFQTSVYYVQKLCRRKPLDRRPNPMLLPREQSIYKDLTIPT